MRNTRAPYVNEARLALRTKHRSIAFERLAGFVAIRQTQSGDEVLRQLLLHVATLPAASALATASEFAEQIDELFGLRLSESRVQSALDTLVGKRDLSKPSRGAYVLSATARVAILQRISESRQLEQRVRDRWLESSLLAHPELDVSEAWRSLEEYLSRAFRQHGIQTMALLDPSIELSDENQTSLRAMLGESVEQHCSTSQRSMVRECISDFLLNASKDADRSAFIARLADCTVSYYSLAVPPDVAEQLRSKLKPLTVFLDTNVLFGLVGLDDRPLVELSHELVALINSERLPIRLRYHSSTEKELVSTFATVSSRLKGSIWSQMVSRNAARSSRVSTIQRLYHERNAEQPVTPETFFKPYEHIDVLIQEKGISLYREPSIGDKQRLYDLIADYNTFLEQGGRVKGYEAVQHDMELLDCVRRMRSKAKSSLEAEALCMTTDFLLWKFDRRQSLQRNQLPTMILAPQLLQLLRPFVSITPDFDRSFADSFAIPEFRAMGDGGQAATGRLLELIASYQNLSEETVNALFANDLFLDGLSGKSDEEMHAYVESAIAAENDRLGKERDRLADELAAERVQRQQLILEARAAAEADAKKRIDDAHTEVALQEREASKQREEVMRQGLLREGAESRALSAEATAAELQSEREARMRRDRLALGILAGLVFYGACETCFSIFGFQWLLSHPQSYGLRGAFCVFAISISVALFRKDLRSHAIGISVVPVLGIVLQLLGGPKASIGDSTPSPASSSSTPDASQSKKPSP